MPTIRRLPQAVADAIAAGEVIERPASVVKELIENAVDAGAGRIDVAVTAGGLDSIVVSDDGAGIAAEELQLAVAPHATSKISTADDLAAVRTLGFRGEALSSIAAVADLRIVSCPGPAGAAAMLRVRHSQVVETGTVAAPPGTQVSVAELFAATPARLRFLKGERAESAAIRRICGDLALTRPAIAVSLRVDGAESLRTPGEGSFGETLRAVLGRHAADGLLAVDAPGDIRVEGAISPPNRHQGSRSGLVLAVNGRRIHSPALAAAVADAYRGLIPAGRHPYGVLKIEVAPGEVDVNVHPAKREVRFHDERAVFTAVQRACWAALRTGSIPVPLSVPAPLSASGWSAAGDQAALELGDAGDDQPATADLRSLAPLRVLGQSDGEWIVATAATGALVVIDPHAAHEKVLYSALLEHFDDGATPDTQLLLLPAVVDVTPRQQELLAEHGSGLDCLGFRVEPFGAGMVRCTAVPAAAAPADPARLVPALLDELDDRHGSPSLRHRVAALTACHAAVRFGDRLDPAQQQRVVDRLVATPGGATCPHGRPTALVLDGAGLRRAFRRPAG